MPPHVTATFHMHDAKPGSMLVRQLRLILTRTAKSNICRQGKKPIATRPHLRFGQTCSAMASVNGRASDVKPLNDLFTGLSTTIFTVMTNLAVKHETINLGQGFPDEEGPDRMKQLVGAATTEHHNQYPPMFGIPELRQAVARHSKTYSGVGVQWDTETLVTVGATEAIAASFLGILNEGDEVNQAVAGLNSGCGHWNIV